MKNIILVIIISSFLFPFISFAQTSKTDQIVVEIDMTKDEIYTRSLSFFAYYFKSAQHTIQVQNEKNGMVIGKGILSGGRSVTITIECKDGKYRQTIEMSFDPFTINNYTIFKSYPYLHQRYNVIGDLVWDGSELNVNYIKAQLDKNWYYTYEEMESLTGNCTMSKRWCQQIKIDIDSEIKLIKNKYESDMNLYNIENKKVLSSISSTLKSHLIAKDDW